MTSQIQILNHGPHSSTIKLIPLLNKINPLRPSKVTGNQKRSKYLFLMNAEEEGQVKLATVRCAGFFISRFERSTCINSLPYSTWQFTPISTDLGNDNSHT